MSGRGRLWLLGYLLLGACTPPPLTLYTLGPPPEARPAGAQLGKKPVVIAVARVTIPDELDTEDIMVRDGSVLRRSSLGRWASRLSLGITDRLTSRLAARNPTALVTDRPLADVPSERVLINISRLDVSSASGITLDADWMVVPHDTSLPARRDRVHLTATGPVTTDQDVVSLLGGALDRLAESINLGRR
jgi:uncharacterized protein